MLFDVFVMSLLHDQIFKSGTSTKFYIPTSTKSFSTQHSRAKNSRKQLSIYIQQVQQILPTFKNMEENGASCDHRS